MSTWHWISTTALVLAAATATRADLDAYVKAPDPSFAWTLERNEATDDGTATFLRLTSQTWRGIPWTHALQVYQPKHVTYPDAALLFINGGRTGGLPGPDDATLGFGLAKLCGARVVVLPQVPNQPLLGGKVEDDLIATTFVEYLDSKDETWPLLFPMVKSAVRAMDAVQQWADAEDQPKPTRFVVTGASKRGWTTWLTGAVDNRVAAIAPMVIPTLNMKAQIDHQLEVWGKFSDQIADYTSRGLTDKVTIESPEGMRLWHMIDPYSYRDRLTMPKLQINGTNDPYWTLDSMNLYWDDLEGPKLVVYLPNAGHGLEEHRDYATHGIAALFRSVIGGRPLPELSWTHEDDSEGEPRLTIESRPAPELARLWVATSETRDFRESTWEPRATAQGDRMVFTVEPPGSGRLALFGDMTYTLDEIEYHLSTQIRDVGPRE